MAAPKRDRTRLHEGRRWWRRPRGGSSAGRARRGAAAHVREAGAVAGWTRRTVAGERDRAEHCRLAELEQPLRQPGEERLGEVQAASACTSVRALRHVCG